MSKQAARAFYEKIQSDPALTKKITDRGAELTGPAAVQLAREAGFECSADELGEIISEIRGELGDEQLDQVSGGTSPRDAASGLPTGKRMHKPLTLATDVLAAAVLKIGKTDV